MDRARTRRSWSVPADRSGVPARVTPHGISPRRTVTALRNHGPTPKIDRRTICPIGRKGPPLLDVRTCAELRHTASPATPTEGDQRGPGARTIRGEDRVERQPGAPNRRRPPPRSSAHHPARHPPRSSADHPDLAPTPTQRPAPTRHRPRSGADRPDTATPTRHRPTRPGAGHPTALATPTRSRPTRPGADQPDPALATPTRRPPEPAPANPNGADRVADPLWPDARLRRSAGQQPQAPPQQPPPWAGAEGAAAPPRATATVESSLTVSSWPCGQAAGADASLIGRLTSKVSPQARHRNS